MQYKITAPNDAHRVDINLPSSKSLSNRALIIQQLCKNPCKLLNLSECDDTAVMKNALEHPEATTINIGAAGTAMRFLTAYLARCEGREVLLTGSRRMLQRPIGVLVDALRTLGADIQYEEDEGFPPLRIRGKQLHGGRIEIDGSISSQYISALMMIAPTLENGIIFQLTGDVASEPYIRMTLGMLAEFGIKTEWSENQITIRQQDYTTTEYQIESDWSAASYWYEIMTLTEHTPIRLLGLLFQSWQGDADGAEYFDRLGVNTTYKRDGITLHRNDIYEKKITWNLSGQPDLAQTFIATCCALGVRFDFTGLSTLRIKETDRIAALQKELAKLGFVLFVENDDRMIWDGTRCQSEEEPVIETYNDHRMAMALAPLAVIRPDRTLIIDHPEVVTKSYPNYWEDLKKAGFEITEIVDDDV